MSTPTLAPEPAKEKLAYSADEVCALLGFSRVTLWRLEKAGRLRSVPDIGVKIYPRAELERFLKLPKAGGAS